MIVTIQEARAAMGSDVVKDTDLLLLIQQAQAQFEIDVDRTFEREVDKEARLDDIKVLEMKSFRTTLYPVETLVIVGWDDGDDEPADYSDPLVEGTDIRLEKTVGRVTFLGCRSGSGWPGSSVGWFDHYKYKMTGGYAANSTDKVWRTAKLAIITLMKFMHAAKHRDRIAYSFSNAPNAGSYSQTIRASDPMYDKLVAQLKRRA